jgi:hypothetical protein
VAVGDVVRVPFELSADNTLSDEQLELLCQGPVAVAARIRDTLSGDSPLSVRSDAFRPAGCP